jgi:hypothetical protein
MQAGPRVKPECRFHNNLRSTHARDKTTQKPVKHLLDYFAEQLQKILISLNTVGFPMRDEVVQ